ncbi:microcystinase C [Pseudomonas amygdali pv. eriobotryae]|uniref:Microcystinase C n=2 Tax=Pseudomonas amygdali TaxID=47877 RepID=A0A9P3EFI0_PSEA0|nr:microcystinase C [Pseudomonas amygdali pv. eriobotryae]
MNLKTIFCAELYQESHSFNPIITGIENFEVHHGEEAMELARGANSVLGGIVDAAAKAGVAIKMSASYHCSPAGAIDHKVYTQACDEILADARKGGFDAIVLAMHGAMLTTECDDPEGSLMHRLREIVGPDLPITAGLDLHAHVTLSTLSACDFLTGFKTNPHADMAETGARAFTAAKDIVEGRFRPTRASVHVPMLTLGRDRTDAEPLMGLHHYAAQAIRGEGFYDISIFNVQQFLNIPKVGQTIVVYGNGSADVTKLADDVAQKLWALRDEVIGTYPSLESLLDRASQPTQSQTIIIGDQGDRVAGGGPGDSTFILTRLLHDYPKLRAAVPIRDSAALLKLKASKVGDDVTITLGGTYSKDTAPVTVEGVLHACGANVTTVFEGPSQGGAKLDTGEYAVVRKGDIYIVVTELPQTYMDPNFYRAMQVSVEDKDVLVARSGYHFSLNYASLGECVTADTPGMTAYHPKDQAFTVARPFYPVDDIPYSPVRTFQAARSVATV